MVAAWHANSHLLWLSCSRIKLGFRSFQNTENVKMQSLQFSLKVVHAPVGGHMGPLTHPHQVLPLLLPETVARPKKTFSFTWIILVMWLANLTGLFVNLMKSIFQLDLGHEDIDLHFFLRKSCTFTKLSLMSAQDSFWIVSGVQRVPRVYSVTQSISCVFCQILWANWILHWGCSGAAKVQ